MQCIEDYDRRKTMHLHRRSLRHASDTMFVLLREQRLERCIFRYLLSRFDMAFHPIVTTLRTTGCLMVLVALVGCGSGPSESDIERIVKANVAQERAAIERMAGTSGAGLFATVHAVKKLGCKEASSSVYVCDVELDVIPPRGTRTKGPTTLRFAKGSDGWAVMR